MNNYIASKVNFTKKDDNIFEINGKIYSVDYDLDPEYIDDGVLDISYYKLYDENDEESKYILAFDKIEDIEDPQEWSDVYDSNNAYVLEFN